MSNESATQQGGARLPFGMRFAESLGIRFPIFQAPVGSVAGPDLAAAVCEAGGMGALALTWRSRTDARDAIAAVRARTKRPFQVNFVLAFETPALEAVLDTGVDVVTFSWGMPRREIAAVHAAGARCGIQVTTVEGARCALDLGADFLICQGLEAGGHVQGTRPLWDVLPRIVEASGSQPVIASGGIGNGNGVARALQLGASGAMLGTRFVATRESLAHDVYKQRIAESRTSDSLLTLCFDGGWPQAAHRALDNSTMRAWEAAGCPPVGRRPGEGEPTATDATGRVHVRYEDTPPRRDMTGDVEAMALYAGTSCGDIHEIASVAEVLARLWDECQAALAQGGVDVTSGE
jgi:NAD(P)H-dependent flavin oxidoreductase YrpB (nitropropane dioxygenase family)